MSAISNFTRWLHRKQYQIEVSLSVYIFTPWEKFIFYTIVFLLVGLTFIATILYLPQHIAFIVGRAWFYMHGENVDVVEVAKEAVDSAILMQAAGDAAAETTVTQAIVDAAAGTAETVVREL